MAVSTTTTKIIAEGNGTATSFSFSPMVLLDRTHLQVTKTDSEGNETVLTWGTGAGHYTISPDSFPTIGSVIYPTNHATSDPTRLQAGETLTMKRVLPLLQSTVMENQGGWFPKTQERTHDYGRMVDLQQQEQLDRAVVAPVSDGAASLVLPRKAVRAGKLLAFNAEGEPVAAEGMSGVVVSAFAATLLDDASAGEARSTLGAATALSELRGSPITLPTNAGFLLLTGFGSATRITLLFDGMSADGTDNFAIRIGPSAGTESSSTYNGAISLFGASSVATSNFSTSFLLTADAAAADAHWGEVVLTLLDRTTSTWTFRSSLSRTGQELMMGAGKKAIAGTLDQLRIFTTGTNNFDGGTINIIVE